MNNLELRDLFALYAMQGYVAADDLPFNQIAGFAYDLAEAMIKEKEKRDGLDDLPLA
jgi:hypothetical protein